MTEQIAAEAARKMVAHGILHESNKPDAEQVIKSAVEKATESADRHAAFCTKMANERLEEIAKLKRSAASAIEHYEKTKKEKASVV